MRRQLLTARDVSRRSGISQFRDLCLRSLYSLFFQFQIYSPTVWINILYSDLYVYMLGLGKSNQIPLSTVVGMAKSIISVILLFSANKASKAIRGSGIV